MTFWKELWKADNSQVHTPTVILMILGTIIMALAIVLIIYHSLYHGKGLDEYTVKLILGLLGGGVLNAGASYYQRTTVSSLTNITNPEAPTQPPARTPKPE